MKINEPVAWMLETQRGKISCFVKPSDEFDWIPLYTHPHSEESVKAKTLTDEEIWDVWQTEFNDAYLEESVLPNFARAILRKAQENG